MEMRLIQKIVKAKTKQKQKQNTENRKFQYMDS